MNLITFDNVVKFIGSIASIFTSLGIYQTLINPLLESSKLKKIEIEQESLKKAIEQFKEQQVDDRVLKMYTDKLLYNNHRIRFGFDLHSELHVKFAVFYEKIKFDFTDKEIASIRKFLYYKEEETSVNLYTFDFISLGYYILVVLGGVFLCFGIYLEALLRLKTNMSYVWLFLACIVIILFCSFFFYKTIYPYTIVYRIKKHLKAQRSN